MKLTHPTRNRLEGGTVSVIVDHGAAPYTTRIESDPANGKTLTTANGVTTFTWKVSVLTDYSYYYIQVDEPVSAPGGKYNYRAVTAPVFPGQSEEPNPGKTADIITLLKIKAYILGVSQPTGAELDEWDFNGDGNVDGDDLEILENLLLKKN